MDLKSLLFGFLLFYCITVVKSIYLFGFLSLYSIYLYAGAFFIYSRFFFDLIGYKSFLYVSIFGVVRNFKNNTGFILICICFLSHYVMDMIYIFSVFRKRRIIKEIKHNNIVQSIGLVVMFVVFPVILYKFYIQFMYIRSHGYEVLYNGNMLENVSMPVWTFGSVSLFTFGYLLVLVSRPSKRFFLLSSVLYLGAMLFDSLKGQRSVFLTSVITVIFFYRKLYPGKKISLKLIVSLFLLLVSFSVFITTLRSNTKLSRMDVKTLVFGLFYSQGVSIVLPLIIIEDGDTLKYHSYPFIFSPLFYRYYQTVYPTTAWQSVIKLKRYNGLHDIASYKWTPKGYLNGNGLGSAFLAEMYDCGGILGIIFWSAVAALVFNFIERFLLKNIVCVVMFWFLIKSITYLPRNRFFGSFFDPHLIVFLPILIMIVVFFINYAGINKTSLKNLSG
jgi:oligosaccharide repeat unit polymerase